MSLNPIRVKKRKNRTKTRYARFSGWHTDPTSVKRPNWNPSPRQLKALAVLFLIVIATLSADQASKVLYPSNPPPNPTYDPFTLLWNGTTTGSVAGNPFFVNSVMKINCSGACVSPSIGNVHSGDFIMVNHFCAGGTPGATTVSDSFSDTYSTVIVDPNNGAPQGAIYKTTAGSSGSVTVTVTQTCTALNGSTGQFSVEVFRSAVSIGASAVGATAASGNTVSDTQTITVGVGSLVYEALDIAYSTGNGSCPTYSNGSGQTTSQDITCFAENNSGTTSGRSVYTPNLGSGSQSFTMSATGSNNGLNNIPDHFVVELAVTNGGTCPSGYSCIFSGLSPNNNIQLNAKPGASTLDSFSGTANVKNNVVQFDGGETFTITGASWQIQSAQFTLNQTGPWTGVLMARILRISSGTPGVDANYDLTKPFLAVSQPFSGPLTQGPAVPLTFNFTSSPVLSPGSYYVELTTNGAFLGTSLGNPQVWFQSTTFAGHNGATGGPSGTPITSPTFIFKVVGSPTSAVALTNSPIDVSTSASKELFFFETWHNTTVLSTISPWGWYITTNATLPTQPNYSPLNDSSVVMANFVYPNAGATSKNYYEYLAKTGSTTASTLLSTSGAGSNPYPLCPQTSTLYMCAGNEQAASSSNFFAISTTLNYTGTGANTANGGFSLFCVDTTPTTGPPASAFCSSATQTPTTSPCTTGQVICDTTVLPFLNMQSGPYYLGFWSSVGQTATIQFGTSNSGAAAQRANSVWYWVPNPPPQASPPATISEAGFFGPLIKALLGIGIWIASNILSFFPWLASVLGPVIAAAFGILVPFIVVVLNAIGNGLGLGNVGTDISTLLTEFVIFFTNQLPTALLNLGTLFSRYFDFLTVLFVWAPVALAVALNLLSVAINTIAFIVTVTSDIFTLWNTIIVLMLILFFFADVGEFGLGGFQAFFEQFKFLVFGLGFGPLLQAIHYGTDIILLFVGILPKPLIQMAAKFDNLLPTVHISGSPTWPSFNMNELKEGNYFSVLGFLIGMVVLVWFETTALPGSITALVPGVGTELTRDAPIVNLFLMMLEIFGFVALFVLPGQMMKGIGPITPGIGFDQLKFRRGPSVQQGKVSASFGLRGRQEPGRILARAQRKLGESKLQKPSAEGVG